MSTIFTGSLAERISFVRKQSKAKRCCKQEVLMNAEFRYRGRQKEIVIRFFKRETGLLAAVPGLGRVLALLGMIKKLLGL